MNKIFNYAFILIALLIVLAYYKGSLNIISHLGTQSSKIINTLQGRDPNTGNFENYPV